MASTPYVFVHPSDNMGDLIQLVNNVPMNVRSHTSIEKGKTAMNTLHRIFLQLALDSPVCFSRMNTKFASIEKAEIIIERLVSTTEPPTPININSDELIDCFRKDYIDHIFHKNEKIAYKFAGNMFKFTIANIQSYESDTTYGILTNLTSVMFTKKGNFQLSTTTQNQIFQPNFDFKDLDIGGLNEELTSIFRKVFVSRLLSSNIVDKLKLSHVKGMILYGPPGTGKTLIARQLSKSLKAKSIQIVNGPELINKYVGQSEENIRKLFAAAEQDMQANEEGLHVIIFDEFDSLCKKRGESSGTSGDLNDKIVTQLLSKIDGINSLNNVLLIGMTNRMELLDPAILRPGRFEVHVEIGLPDEQGRIDILKIHTKALAANGCLAENVSIPEIAAATKNYTGAELEGLVRDARSYAVNELVNIQTLDKKIELKDIRVKQEHFDHAIASYVPKFGTSDVDINYYMPNGIIDYCEDFVIMKDEILHTINEFKQNSKQLYSILLKGPTGSGKTAFSAYIAQQTKFSFIKIISNNDMIGFSESAKIQYMKEIFEESYISNISLIVIDSIETIVEYYRDEVTGSLRFMSSVFNAIRTLLRKIPIKKGHKLCIIANYDLMNDLDRYVDHVFEMPIIDGVPVHRMI